MRKLIIISLILFFTAPIFAEDSKFKLSFDDKPKTIFKILQYSSWLLMNADTVCTYNSIWNYGCWELNPILRELLPYPEVVFVYRIAVNIGVVLITNQLYKKSKFLAYASLIVINAVATYFIYDHIRSWKN